MKTLYRINEALDKRFERDTTLYIGKKEKEKIKKFLYLGELQNLNVFIKKYNSKIISKIIIENSYLIKLETMQKKEFQNFLFNLFSSLEPNFLKKVSKKILEDKIFSPNLFKEFIKRINIRNLSHVEAMSIYSYIKTKPSEKIICLEIILYENYITHKNITKLLEEMNREFEKNCLIDYIENNRIEFFKESLEKISIEEKEQIVSWILKRYYQRETEYLWLALLIQLREISFYKILDFLSEHNSFDIYDKNNKILLKNYLKKIIEKIISDKNNLDKNQIDRITIFYNQNIYYRKFMMEMIKNLNKNKKNKILIEILIKYFDNIEISGEPKRIFESIKADKIEEKFTFESVLQEIDSNNKLEYRGTLEYFRIVLGKNLYILEELYYNKMYHEKVKEVILYVFSSYYKREKLPAWYKELNLDEIYKEEIANNIKKYEINTSLARDFLYENKYYKILERFNER